ncbi:MAG: hypothetical protein IJW70_09550 [Clostridia bacterium]|nr:hypothetical protein [Clostridia bacterium]
MPIQTTTVYTKERLLRFNYYYQLVQRKWFLILLVFEMAIAAAWLIKDIADGLPVSDGIILLFLIAWVLGITWMVTTLIVPRFSYKKAKSLNAVIEMTFSEESMRYSVSSAYTTESGELQYSMFVKYVKNKDDLYLFISTKQVWIVDLLSLTPEQTEQLHTLLSQKIVSKKNKW